MKAIILAAGQGTRLRPYTDDRPKATVELAGVSLLDRQKAVLRDAGIRDITVIAGYRHKQIPADGCRIVINPRYAETNMVATLFCAHEVLTGDEDIIISYGDIIYEPRVLEALMACDTPFAVTVDKHWRAYWELRQEDPLADAETLKMDDTGRLLELGKKPKCYDEIQAQYMGLIKIRADMLPDFSRAYGALDPAARYDGKSFGQMYMTSFIQRLIDSGWPVQAVPVEGGWLEVDTASDLELYERLAREGRLDSFCQLEAAVR